MVRAGRVDARRGGTAPRGRRPATRAHPAPAIEEPIDEVIPAGGAPAHEERPAVQIPLGGIPAPDVPPPVGDQVVGAVAQAPTAGEPVVTFAQLVRDYGRLGGTRFTPTASFTDVDTWIHQFERHAGRMKLSDGDQAELAAHMMDGEAGLWWDMVEPEFRTRGLTYALFQQEFRDRFVPQAIQKDMVREFTTLRQGSRDVTGYTQRFIALSCYAPALVPSERERSMRYVEGFSASLRQALLPSQSLSFTHLFSLALSLEGAAREASGQKNRPASSQPESSRSQFRRQHQSSGRGRGAGTHAPSRGGSSRSASYLASVVCHTCGRTGHMARQCTVVCHTCGVPGHIAPQCPQRRALSVAPPAVVVPTPGRAVVPAPVRTVAPAPAPGQIQVVPPPPAGRGRGRGGGQGRGRAPAPQRGGRAYAIAPGQPQLDGMQFVGTFDHVAEDAAGEQQG